MVEFWAKMLIDKYANRYTEKDEGKENGGYG
jgi:hypothetical protein